MTANFTQELSQILVFNSVNIALYVVAVGAIILLAYNKIRSMERQAAIYLAAARTADEFYQEADSLLGSADVPAPLKESIYDLVFAVTYEKAGRTALHILTKSMGTEPSERQLSENKAYCAILELREANPALASKVDDAIRAGLVTLFLAYGKFDDRMVYAVKTTGRDKLSSAVAAIKGHYGDRNDGCAPQAA